MNYQVFPRPVTYQYLWGAGVFGQKYYTQLEHLQHLASRVGGMEGASTRAILN